MASATGLDGGRIHRDSLDSVDQFQTFSNLHLVSPFQNVLLTIPLLERIATTSTNMNPKPLNAVMTETITESLDDHQEVVFVVDHVPLTPVSSIQTRTDIQDDAINVMPPTPDPPDASLLPSSPSRISPPATYKFYLLSTTDAK